jgi:hypothetical protein
LFQEEIGLEDRSKWVKKKGDNLDRRDHRLSKGEGGWDGGVYSFIQINPAMENLIISIATVFQRSKK